MLGGAARGQRSCGSHLSQRFESCEANSNSLSERKVALVTAILMPSHRIFARSALVWMEDALETGTITAPDRCHRSRLDHRVCGRPARNRVLVQCSPDRSRTVDHHPTMTVNPILPIRRPAPARITSTPHAPRPARGEAAVGILGLTESRYWSGRIFRSGSLTRSSGSRNPGVKNRWLAHRC